MFVLTDILRRLGVEHSVLGTKSTGFRHLAPADEAVPDGLVYLNAPREDALGALRSTPASVVLLPREWGQRHEKELSRLPLAVVLVDEPRLVFGRVLAELFPEEDPWPPGVHPTAIVHPDAKLDPSVSIGPYAVIGRCSIGEGSRIGAFSVIKDGVEIGRRVTVREHCLLGGAGFGYARGSDGKLHRIPHVGRVVIEDDVDLFPFVNVDRATLTETRIKRGTKVDHYGHVGHNCTVGEDCVITAQVVFCGKSRMGDRTWAGVGAVLKQGVVVGSDVTLGLGTVVLADVPDGETVVGVPGRALPKR